MLAVYDITAASVHAYSEAATDAEDAEKAARTLQRAARARRSATLKGGVLAMAAVGGSLPSAQALSTTGGGAGLSGAYASIRRECVERADGWPHSANILAKFEQDEATGVLSPPRFDDGHGPLGVYAMLHDNAGALALLRWCRGAFEQLVRELAAPLSPAQRARLALLTFKPEERTYHTVVAVFHEHPSLLSEEQKDDWRPVDPPLCEACAAALQRRHEPMRAPTLALDSMCLTADGALIAGFVDDDEEAFAALRASSVEEAQEVIVGAVGGALTSRPKRLIHVTLGRLLGAPEGLGSSERAHFASVAARYNEEALPGWLASEGGPPREFTLERLSLVRDEIWPMQGFTELASWRLSEKK